jgi:hypothetical protein
LLVEQNQITGALENKQRSKNKHPNSRAEVSSTDMDRRPNVDGRGTKRQAQESYGTCLR